MAAKQADVLFFGLGCRLGRFFRVDADCQNLKVVANLQIKLRERLRQLIQLHIAKHRAVAVIQRDDGWLLSIDEITGLNLSSKRVGQRQVERYLGSQVSARPSRHELDGELRR